MFIEMWCEFVECVMWSGVWCVVSGWCVVWVCVCDVCGVCVCGVCVWGVGGGVVSGVMSMWDDWDVCWGFLTVMFVSEMQLCSS